MKKDRVHSDLFFTMILFFLLSLPSFSAWAIHPVDGTGKMDHPTIALPDGVLTPSVSFNIYRDLMEGYNLFVETKAFNITVPMRGTADSIENILQGHAHLYINGDKKMRVYGDKIHIPLKWLKDGINSITLSINNHQHETFTLDNKEIQSTMIINTRDESSFIKSQFHWPK
jgi:hypothetical protein